MLPKWARTTSSVLIRVSRARAAAKCAVQRRTISSDPADYFHFTRVVFGTMSPSFVTRSLRHQEPAEPIDLGKAIQQHENYVTEVKKLIPHAVQVPADDALPDLVYVEDPAVVLDGKALITRMGQPTRAEEVKHMRPVLAEMGIQLFEVDDPEAIIDGGDVMFTGREFLVGLTKRTNKAGVEQLRRVFPEWPVTGITVSHPVLHLKSMSSVCGVDTIAISNSPAGRQAWREIESTAHFKHYKPLVFPDDNGANCLFINGTVLHPPQEEYPESYKVWQKVDLPRVEVPNSEMSKADGSLTCNSIRIQ